MLKLNKTTEYGLMALGYIHSRGGSKTSAREIAEKFDLPFEILAKTLQKLKDQGLISSHCGTQGGYILARDLKSLNMAEFLEMMEGPLAIVGCLGTTAAPESEAKTCDYHHKCGIKGPMGALNDRIHDFFRRISLAEITQSQTALAGFGEEP